ncbi:hypothetical protein CPLU01_12216 [Colletotrichum plurivorum]|uniref:G-patch domain-containing protein n=1 Tax=Colletotrichum plurivorum TaxID=2175906 RepID=A0A8H6K0H0_9PEZI|nr:hypothetical protein CPLU01_12216 [Colletotrichum plurivorum]
MLHTKRSRAAYDAHLHEEAVAHIRFGTPLPPLDPDIRDDGSYVPLYKQEVRDERGRRRLHGAFTGGWSAGYFNTVGSKEGWTPSTFVSYRTNRRKNDPTTNAQRPEDYMDDEDLADAATSRYIRTADSFAGLGSSRHGRLQGALLAGLVRTEGNTIGFELLRKMGWKTGQGIGPKIRRKARLSVSMSDEHSLSDETHLFAPEDVQMIILTRKADRKGLAGSVESSTRPLPGDDRDSSTSKNGAGTAKNGLESGTRSMLGLGGKDKKEGLVGHGSFGVGVLNDSGSDEDDPYELGPRISYNRFLGGDKGKKKRKPAPASVPVNPTLGSRPLFVSKASSGASKVNLRCHDGKLPLNGFTIGHTPGSRSTGKPTQLYPPPTVPRGWTPAKWPSSPSAPAVYLSTVEAAKAVGQGPKSRAAILGETLLRGKSVFDYISEASRARLISASGRIDLPPAKGEVHPGNGGSVQLLGQANPRSSPRLPKETAVAAMSRGAGAGGPYESDEAKRGRYRLYLQHAAGLCESPAKPPNMTDDDFARELGEFYGCAQLFKPMTGFMATRFTTASSEPKTSSEMGSEVVQHMGTQQALTPSRHLDPAEEAAKIGMYGRTTRLTDDFFPSRLLCKRFNVRPPTHVQPDLGSGAAPATQSILPSASTVTNAVGLSPFSEESMATNTGTAACVGELRGPELCPLNQAYGPGGASRPSHEVFKAIFGDSSDDEE